MPRASEAARHKKRLRVAYRRNRHGLRVRNRRRDRPSRPEMTLGPVMLDLSGLKLTVAENELLRHPLAGRGVLFARNFESTRPPPALTRASCARRRPGRVMPAD